MLRGSRRLDELFDQPRVLLSRGRLYRALNPVYARQPLSGRGAGLYGGRFNAKGTEALYTATDPATALREANQVGDLQPTTLVSYRADLGPVFDTRDADALTDQGMTDQGLADPAWRKNRHSKPGGVSFHTQHVQTNSILVVA